MLKYWLIILGIYCVLPTAAQQSSFRLPKIPLTLCSSQEKAEYLGEHFWDCCDLSDSTLFMNPRLMLDYIYVLYRIPFPNAERGIVHLLNKAVKYPTSFEWIVFLFDRYLYDPFSPIHNENLYIPVLQYIVSSQTFDDLYKSRYKYQLEMALKNREGSMAVNFDYVLADGKQCSMYDLKADYILIYFNNPDCSECLDVKKKMTDSNILNLLIKKGLMTVLAIYPGEDIVLWKCVEYPFDWLNGYDKGGKLYARKLYSMKRMPSIYLLDKNKTVLLKEQDWDIVERFLKELRFTQIHQ